MFSYAFQQYSTVCLYMSLGVQTFVAPNKKVNWNIWESDDKMSNSSD